MKPRNLFELLGARSSPRRYGYAIKEFSLPPPGRAPIRFAQWLHPKAEDYRLTEDMVRMSVRMYARFIRPGDFCIDIGAHCGDSTLPIALAAGPEGAVLAMEPNPFVFPVLEKNARLNTAQARILPLLAAAGREPGAMEFEYSDPGYCNGGRHENISSWKHGHAYKLSVHAVDLASELRSDYADRLPALRFIKVDAEGYDLYVLQSLAGIIDEFRPYVKAEVFKRSASGYRRELLQFFLGRGYEVRRIVAEPCVPGEALSIDAAMRWPHYDIFCSPVSWSD